MKKVKKIIGLLLSATLIFAFCGTVSATEPSEEEEDDFSSLAEETTDHVVRKVNATTTINDKEQAAKEKDVEGDYKTGSFGNLTFEYPAVYEYQVEDDAGTIMLGDGSQTMVLFMSADMSGSGEEYDDDTVDFLLTYALLSSLSAYDDYQNESIEDMVIDGRPAKEFTALIYIGSTLMNNNCIAIYNADDQYIYEIQYASTDFEDGNISEYVDIVNSVSFGGEAEPDPESADEEAIVKKSAKKMKAESGDGYEITYGDYYLYERSDGEIKAYAIVEVENTGETNLQLKSGTFSFEDDEGNLMGVISLSAYTDPNIIMPGERGYFYTDGYSVDGDLSVDGDYTFVPELTLKETDKEPVIFEVSDTSISEGKRERVDVMGRITNPTDEDYNYLRIAIVLFDDEDNPIAVYGTTVSDLTAGSTKSFDADSMSLDNLDFNIDDVARYEVIARK